ncbi:MAG: peptidase M28 [Verrucomicrobia bacterium]|nr:MAG: peptidase M28 [Verrucomicrobiota bacterium]
MLLNDQLRKNKIPMNSKLVALKLAPLKGRYMDRSADSLSARSWPQSRVSRGQGCPRSFLALLILCSLNAVVAQDESGSSRTNDVIAQIIEEGINHSQVMTNLGYLTEVIGPRLTGSPNLKRANEWTRDRLACWGLTNAHLEAWGPFGRGWTLQKFSAQIVEPQAINLIAYPNAWSPGLKQSLVARVVYFDARTNADLKTFEGKLKGAIVLAGPMREPGAPPFEPQARRLVATNLLALANAGQPREGRAFFQSPDQLGGPPSTNRAGALARRRRGSSSRFLSFLTRQGAALIVNQSSQGDGGAVFVSAASVPRPGSETNNEIAFGSDSGPNATNQIRAWATNAPAMPPQITVAAEDYNRMGRMIQEGEKLKMAVDLKVKFNNDDLMAYNTVAEIPGTDLNDEIVMLGGHLDSWHSGTGATDNGAGVAATMEAVRIITALKLKPRRTIRIALWSGEEQGIYGSKAYVAEHFGYFTNLTPSVALARPGKEAGGDEPSPSTYAKASADKKSKVQSPKSKDEDGGSGVEGEPSDTQPATRSTRATTSETLRKLVRRPDYEKFSIYFNLDNGAGKIRGVYLQGNEALRPIFRRWLEPFREMGAETLALSNTGSTDHMSFDAVGLPGLEFIQDPLDYMTRTHHSNLDVLDRIQPEDLKQAATIIAAFVYNAAMADEKMPRKPLVENPPRRGRAAVE